MSVLIPDYSPVITASSMPSSASVTGVESHRENPLGEMGGVKFSRDPKAEVWQVG